jgi:hypothetical protein
MAGVSAVDILRLEAKSAVLRRFEPFNTQWSLFALPGVTFTNFTFCPHSVFVCFVWIWEQTAIISLYSINWLLFITETECVYCTVRSALTVYLCILCGSQNKQRLFPYMVLNEFITQAKCVYCAVRIEYLNRMQFTTRL